MKLTKREQAAEDIAFRLHELGEEDRVGAAYDAIDMVHRAAMGWWDVVGAPHFTARMERLKKRLKL